MRKNIIDAIERAKDSFGGLSKIVRVEFKDTHRGFAHLDTGKITLPNWIFERGYYYALYYGLHEISHFIHEWHKVKVTETMHGPEFKAIEQRVLGLWGMSIEYKRAYPKSIFVNGNLVFSD